MWGEFQYKVESVGTKEQRHRNEKQYGVQVEIISSLVIVEQQFSNLAAQ